MHRVASQVVSSAGATFDFQNIPSTYTHLQIRMTGRSNNSSNSYNFYYYFNADTTPGNYAEHSLYGNGTSVVSNSGTSQNIIHIVAAFPASAALSNTFGSMIMDILDYTSSKNKTTRALFGWDDNNTSTTYQRSGLASGVWLSSAAINRITIAGDNGFAVGTRVDIYGITNNPIATGA
jgi:hypothetical protein